MSLFNLAAGTDPACKAVLATLRTMGVGEIPRFRDAYIDVSGERPLLTLMTRTGGPNRELFAEENQALRVEGFVDDFDDEFDPTFIHFRYEVPEEYREVVDRTIARGRSEGWTFPRPMERAKAMIDKMLDG